MNLNRNSPNKFNIFEVINNTGSIQSTLKA